MTFDGHDSCVGRKTQNRSSRVWVGPGKWTFSSMWYCRNLCPSGMSICASAEDHIEIQLFVS